MKAIQPYQMRSIYAIARSIGVNNDNLHSLVACLTGKDSIKALTFGEAGKVIAELNERQKLAGVSPAPRKKAKQHPTTPGGVTSDQQNKAWALMYHLQKFDPPIGGAGVGDRLCGIITKHFGVSSPPAQPFRFLKMAQGIELIQLLGKMAERAEKKSLQEGRAGYG